MKNVSKDLRPEYDRTLVDKIKENFPRIMGVTLVGLSLVGTSYLIGNHKGKEEGKRLYREDIITSLIMDRHDALQFAKFAGTSKEQDKLLDYAYSITKTLELLGYNDIKNDSFHYPTQTR